MIGRLKTAAKTVRNRGASGLASIVRGGMDYYLEPDQPSGMPLFLQVEPTILCNLECSFCINPFLPRTRTSLTPEKFERILDEAPDTTKISLVGIGESFMNKKIFDLIRMAKKRGLEIGTTSNGTVLNDRILGEILDCGLDWLNFSIDGATKETYEKMRPGATFEKVLANITRISNAVENRQKPVLSIWFLSNSGNIHELPDMVELVKSIGIPRLNTQGVHYWGHPDWHDKANEANAVVDLRPALRETQRRAEKAGVEFNWHNFPDPEKDRACKWPWKGSYITADGFVTPCCENGSDPQRINFGNILEQSYEEIWNSAEYREFRRQLRDPNSRPSICEDCPSYHKPIDLGAGSGSER